ncbi:MAG TPA: hypothetical protein VHW24_14325 [Bryobacteraceae bacterium]|jgi:hypothetical protein|nr:hypothetical protein [Bryobacteraceae bacterium]
MADIDLAIADMDELTTVLDNDIKNGGFDVDGVMWLIKAWTKVAVITNGPGIHKRMAGYYIMKRDPSKLGPQQKRSRVLKNAMDAYQQMMENNKTTKGDFFQRADTAMLDFVWEFRKSLKGNMEADFVRQLQLWLQLTEDQVMHTPIFKMDQAA